MAQGSSIEWTEATWNPVTGCTKVSAGCKHCYAERMAKRLQAMGVDRYAKGFALTLQPDVIDLPRQWKKGRTIFVNSMSDLFHEKVPADFVRKVFRGYERVSSTHFSDSHEATGDCFPICSGVGLDSKHLDGNKRREYARSASHCCP